MTDTTKGWLRTSGFFLAVLMAIIIGIPIALKIMHIGRESSPQLPDPIQDHYTRFPMKGCGKGCEWRRYSDKLWELDNFEKGTVGRVEPVISFPGHWYVQTNSSVRAMESEWPTLDQAKHHVEVLAGTK